MNEHVKAYQDAINKERKLELLVTVAEDRLRKHREKMGCWLDAVIDPIAEELCEYTGHPFYVVYGPFGLKARTTIYLMDNPEKDIVHKPSWALTVIPYIDYSMSNDRKFSLKYETEKIIEEYPRGSIGWMNGMGHEELELPDTIKEIVALLRYNKGCEA